MRCTFSVRARGVGCGRRAVRVGEIDAAPHRGDARPGQRGESRGGGLDVASLSDRRLSSFAPGTSVSSSSSSICSPATPLSTTSQMAFSTPVCLCGPPFQGEASPRTGGAGASDESCRIEAVRRGTAACRHCQGGGRRAGDPSRRRAHRESRHPNRSFDRATARRPQSPGYHGGGHHPRSRDCLDPPSHHRDARRADRARRRPGRENVMTVTLEPSRLHPADIGRTRRWDSAPV